MMASASTNSAQTELISNRMTDSRCSITDITLEQALVRIREIEEENRAHRDNLREHNATMREHHEKLALWRQREQEKFEQAKALITALKGENQDMQVQIMTLKDKEKETRVELTKLEETKSHLRRQKAISDQQLLNVVRQAEAQGVKNLAPDATTPFNDSGSVEDRTFMDSLVYVSTKGEEDKVEKLEATVASKDEIIAQLRAAQIKRDAEIDGLRETTKQLLQDMEGQQKLKESIQNENHNLAQQLLEAQKNNQQQMQSMIAMTKRKMQEPLQKADSDNNSLAISDRGDNSLLEGAAVMVNDRENPENILGLIQSHQKEEEKRLEESIKLESEIKAKQELQEIVNNLTSQVRRLQEELVREKQERETIKTQRDKDMEMLTQDYEHKIAEAVQQCRDDAQLTQPPASGDVSTLRSQVIMLITDVDKAHREKSELTDQLHTKDSKIRELEEAVRSFQTEHTSLWQEKTKLLENLNAQRNQQMKINQESEKKRQQYHQLQVSFSSLVNDFKELEETFSTYRQQMEEKLCKRSASRQSLDEINRLTAQVLAAEEALAVKEGKLAELRAARQEEALLMQMQAETYKSDFLAERESRAKIAEKHACLVAEVTALHDQNRQLKGELDLYNQRQIHNMQARHAGVPASPVGQATAVAQGAAVPPGNNTNFPMMQQQVPDDNEDLPSFQPYECPSCRAQFPDADTVQLHVTECLERENP